MRDVKYDDNNELCKYMKIKAYKSIKVIWHWICPKCGSNQIYDRMDDVYDRCTTCGQLVEIEKDE